MGGYFKFIGVVELLGWIIGLVIYLVNMSFIKDTAGLIMAIVYLVIIIVFGPALGLLFLSYGSHISSSYDKTVNETIFSVGDKVMITQDTMFDSNGHPQILKGSRGIVTKANDGIIDIDFEVGDKIITATVFESLCVKVDSLQEKK